jgi:hypothetical protein
MGPFFGPSGFARLTIGEAGGKHDMERECVQYNVCKHRMTAKFSHTTLCHMAYTGMYVDLALILLLESRAAVRGGQGLTLS